MKLLTAASSGALSMTCAFLLASGCGSDAVAVEACRDIEQARCEAGRHCGLVDDVDRCKRFYRDHCLHGLKTDKTPGDPQVDECVAAIKLAGKCASEGVELLAECTDWKSGTELTTPCDVVRTPEKIELCDFLGATVDAGRPGQETGSDAPAGDGASDAPPDVVSEAAADAPEAG